MAAGAINELVYIAPSSIHGRGLFAARPLPSGQLIGVYRGPVVQEDNSYVLWIENEAGADWTGYEGRNEMRFMNHSDDPNAEMDGLYCYAVRDIALGCEITIDYGWNDS
jgi:SET domain-containing protein